MRGMHHIPVDRDAGRRFAGHDGLKAGEVVGIFPEATISRSFTVKESSPAPSGWPRPSRTPLMPVALWGGQRMLTKGHPKDLTCAARHDR